LGSDSLVAARIAQVTVPRSDLEIGAAAAVKAAFLPVDAVVTYLLGRSEEKERVE
jgi:hypothetical protein